MKKLMKLTAIALASALALTAGTASADKLKVGFIYTSSEFNFIFI